MGRDGVYNQACKPVNRLATLSKREHAIESKGRPGVKLVRQYRSLSNYQCCFEVHLKYMILLLYQEYGTMVLAIIRAPTISHCVSGVCRSKCDILQYTISVRIQLSRGLCVRQRNPANESGRKLHRNPTLNLNFDMPRVRSRHLSSWCSDSKHAMARTCSTQRNP